MLTKKWLQLRVFVNMQIVFKRMSFVTQTVVTHSFANIFINFRELYYVNFNYVVNQLPVRVDDFPNK